MQSDLSHVACALRMLAGEMSQEMRSQLVNKALKAVKMADFKMRVLDRYCKEVKCVYCTECISAGSSCQDSPGS